VTETVRRANVIALFRRVSQTMVSELVARMHDAGYPDISGAHHPVFENIDPQGTRLTTLALRAQLTHQSIGEMVSNLEELGYVTRRSDPSDGRARLVVLTPRGKRMVARAAQEIGKIEKEWDETWRWAARKGDVRTALEAALESRRASKPYASGVR